MIGTICGGGGGPPMKNTAIGIAVIAALIGTPALAADMGMPSPAPAPMYTKAPPPMAYSWTGFYIGANGGGVWGQFDPTSVASTGDYLIGTGSLAAVNAAGIQRISPAGLIGGFEAGYNFQTGPAVFGIEADIEYMHLSGSQQSTGIYPCCAPAAFTISSAASADWLSTIRGRLGYAANNWLFFATGGAAFTDLKGTFQFTDNCGSVPACAFIPGQNGFEPPVSFSNERTGYAVGGGVETGLSANWTVKAEYLYVDFGSVSASGVVTAGPGPFSFPITHSIDLRADIARLGLNYKF
jgi:outer membrane immunogenic protein